MSRRESQGFLNGNSGWETAKPIRAGVIGSGFIGPLHVESLRRLGWVEVVALADQNEVLAGKNAEALSIPRAYGDWRDLVADPDVDVVHNCTPNRYHYEINRAVLEAGKPLVTEKPVSTTSQESGELLRLANEKGIPNEVCFTYCMYPVIQQMRAMVECGDIGRPWSVWGVYLQDWLAKETDYNWRVDPELGGQTRVMADIGSHWFEVSQFILGQNIEAVCAEFSTFLSKRKVARSLGQSIQQSGTAIEYDEIPVTTEDYGTAMVRFEGGTVGSMTASQVAAGRKNHIHVEITGSRSSIAWNHEDAERLWIGKRSADNVLTLRDGEAYYPQAKKYCHYPVGHPQGYSSGFKNLFLAFYTYLRDGRRWNVDRADFPTLWEGHRSMLIIDALVTSAKEHRWVDVNLSGLPVTSQ